MSTNANKKKKFSITLRKPKSKETIAIENRGKILNKETPFFIREAYKALRTNIIFSLPGSGCRKIAVTSALAGEGKSTNCLNMAISFAETGAKTIIIDADLRRPNVSKLLDRKASPGLSNVLVGLNKVEEVINHSQYEHLDVIFSGDIPPNPAELLISDHMKDILDELAKKYEFIFIDCPPINMVTDAAIISKYVSGIILVVRQGETTKDEVSEAKEQLDFGGAKLIGTVLNLADDTKSKYGYRYIYSRRSYESKKRGYYISEDADENNNLSKEKK